MYKIVGADGKEYGPVAVDQLKQWITEGRLNLQSKVLPEGSTEWKTVAQVPELAEAVPITAQTTAPIDPLAGGAQQINPLAMTGFILGLVSVSIGLCCCYGLPFNIAGIIFSAIGLAQIKKSPHRYKGRGFALAGLITSILSILLGVVLLALGFALSYSDIMRELQNR